MITKETPDTFYIGMQYLVRPTLFVLLTPIAPNNDNTIYFCKILKNVLFKLGHVENLKTVDLDEASDSSLSVG